MGEGAPIAQSDQWFRTRSPEQAIHLRETAFYPHRLRLLGPSNSFGFSQRVSRVGPITLGDTTYETDVALDFDDTRASYHVCVPLKGWLKSRHRGQQLTSTPALATIYRPDAEIATTWWPGGSRHLAVKIDQVAVDRALDALVESPVGCPIAFDASLPLNAGDAQDWVRLLLMVHRQLDRPDSLMRHSVVLDPLVESLIHGFLLVAEHPYRQALAAPAEPGRPAAVREAMDLIEAGPQLPLTTSTLAIRCHVSVRTLQDGFRRHLGMSPMAYVRVVRLRRAHNELRSAHPSHTTVATIAHRWGFTHLGRFATAHKATFGETPQQALRAAR
ncbi:AraC family transcriptional regulator [Mycobacterium sp.]|jgi:AraC-like DNA-binding protein|uniref:AraC family transcriptional regulator n=1 Tax=Mycobacterium sp. TaxID=1785 RepID=UPI002D6152BA|nr:AraC family transcriptional regulator [Mycobacterium sp.]HZA08976.1 AraC family transcriptional regulator [Mycobacterium sp.]